ncbi:GMC oxidoreductase [Rhodoferax sp.]|uniref:GMC oxidoreductase n=1 Tax=Rhodoferax sp. TaxID=50421 RepID=UPI0025E11406|nr:GMC oxidoreductase [Rhodoferax sp.]
MTQKRFLEAIIVGSGFGGAVMCCRLAMRWPGEVLLLERGKRYPKGSFARSPHDFAANFWAPAEDGQARKLNGLFDIRNYRRMDSVVSAGLGGGSLIYANVFMPAPAWVFGPRWPAQISATTLAPYYRVAQSVLAARPVPPAEGDARRTIQRTSLYADFARADGRTSRAADIAVFFGKGYASRQSGPLPLGEQERNRYGATQTSCTYCGECDVGCNVHAKNTLDLNYLFAAEKQHGALVETGSEVTRITPLSEAGEPDSTADGRYGYRVDYRDDAGTPLHALARRVVVAAGTLGTNELLLRCRDTLGTLPRLSQRLGHGFSGNGDFLSFVSGGTRAADPTYGPVITQFIDYGLQQPTPGQPSFMLEDAAYPAFAAWYVEGLRPAAGLSYLFNRIARTFKVFKQRWVDQLFSGKWSGSMSAYAHTALQGDLSYRSSVLLFMGQDAADGTLHLHRGRLALDWPQSSSRPLYDAIVACGKRFQQFAGASTYFPQPTWAWPVRNNITVHPLGGCALAEEPAHGVVSSLPGARGQVFGYQRLYVADGSLLPTGVGANPSATIAALAEWIAEDITGMTPDDTLGVPHA